MGKNRTALKKTVIVCSLNDHAGTNIRERLIEKFPFQETNTVFDGSPIYSMSEDIELVSSRKDIIFVDDLDGTFKDVRYVFISKHYAESGIPSLTAHFTGNFGPATFGGKPKEIAMYSPGLLKNYLMALSKKRDRIPESYGITLEATHHGPTSLAYPVLFVELGSTEAQWVDMDTAGVVAESLMAAINAETRFTKSALGIGGTHYSQKLTKLEIDSEFAVGPIVPKHSLEFFDLDLLKQIIQKSDDEVKFALVDQKGLGKFKQQVMKVLDEFPLEKISI
jgi:D-aminoacyl-tRNA deacylase